MLYEYLVTNVQEFLAKGEDLVSPSLVSHQTVRAETVYTYPPHPVLLSLIYTEAVQYIICGKKWFKSVILLLELGAVMIRRRIICGISWEEPSSAACQEDSAIRTDSVCVFFFHLECWEYVPEVLNGGIDVTRRICENRNGIILGFYVIGDE